LISKVACESLNDLWHELVKAWDLNFTVLISLVDLETKFSGFLVEF
jgi:hypothetical protein